MSRVSGLRSAGYLPTPALVAGPDLARLLAKSARGDQEAFATVYDATAARAYALALRVLRDPEQAAECLESAYLHLWTHSALSHPDQGSAISWILTVVHREAVRRTRSMPPVDLDELSLQTMAGRTRTALEELSAAQRQAVHLAYYEGCTHTEVDQRLGAQAECAQAWMRDGLLVLGRVTHAHKHAGEGVPAS